MAAESLTSISNALSQTFEERLRKQWNRLAIFAGIVGAVAGGGKNAAWDVEFSGATALTVAEGSDIDPSEYNSDVNVPATLGWAHYRSSFQVSETEIDAAASSVGIPQALEDLFGERIMSNGAKLASKINADLISGTGVDGSSNPTIIGILGGACDATGTYAGINRSTYSEWAGNVLANSGVGRPLTQDLLASVDQTIFTRSGRDFEYVVTTPGVLRKYEGLFVPAQRSDVQAQTLGLGVRAQGVSTGLFYKGRPVYRDKDMTAGTMFFGCDDCLTVKYLPRAQSPIDAVVQRMSTAVGDNGDGLKTVTQIPIRIAVMAKTGDSVKVSMRCSLQMLNRRANATALLKDILET